jgi:hypothetical protein
VRAFRPDNTDTGVSFFAYAPAFAGGVRVAMGDVDGDGADEIITAPGPGGGPHVRVWRVVGTTPTLLAEFQAYNPAFTGGVWVTAGDVNGDGRAEIITGPDAGGGPHVRVWQVDGSTVTELAGFFAYGAAFTGGARVAAGDVTGDGKADIVTGAGPGGGPHVQVFDGGQLLLGNLMVVHSFLSYPPGFTGGVFVAAGELNGDGKEDIVTGAGAGGGPDVRAFDGMTLGSLASFLAYPAGFVGGVPVAVGP